MNIKLFLPLIVQATIVLSKKSYGEEECPEANSKCSYDGDFYYINKYGTPQCWTSVDNEWKCKPRKENDNKCAEGFTDIQEKCGYDPIDKPTCPSGIDTCELGSDTFTAKDVVKEEEGFPNCWNKDNNGKWTCLSNKVCPIYTKDLKECFKPKPECPKLPTEVCRYGLSLTIPAGGPYTNNAICWSKGKDDDWSCKAKEGFDCESDEIDITTCFKKKVCPKRTDPCLYNAKVYKVDTIGAPKCWQKTALGWSCKFPSIENNECNSDDTDIDTCYPEDKPACPKSYFEACNNHDNTIIAGDPGILHCWSKSKDGDWNCHIKEDNTNQCGRGEIDVSSCGVPPMPVPDCPVNYNETCTSTDDSEELAGEPNEFVCWKKNASKKWECTNKPKGKDKCEPGLLDISTCTLEPPPTPDCPDDYFTSCKNIDDKDFFAGKPLGNVCWYKDNFNNWSCTERSNTSKQCEPGLLDITRCKIEPPTPPPCPKENESTCQSPLGIVSKSNLQNNVCWTNKNSKWFCKPKSKGNSNCEVGELDISLCSGASKLPFSCPTEYQTLCEAKEGLKVFGKIKYNLCWKQDQTSKLWECQRKVDGQCEEGFLDVQLCTKPEKPKTHKICPATYETYCKSKDGYKLAGEETKNICWEIDSNGDYSCEPLIEGKNKCKLLQVNILSCDIPEPKPPKCPTKSSDYCIIGDRKILAGDAKVNLCWGISPFGEYYCAPKESNGSCKPNLIDITTCNIAPPPSVLCPDRSDTCHYQGKNYMVYDVATPKCWSKNEGKWECEPLFSASSKCGKSMVDISKCFPPLPKCPSSYTSMCEDKDKNKLMAGKPGNNICWIKNKSGNWECYAKDYNEKYCSPGYLDVTTCPLPLPSPPKCPKSYTDISFSDKKIVLAGEPGFNVCWNYQGENKWISSPRPNGYGACKPGDLDITTCNFIKPAPPSCPEKYISKCLKGTEVVLAGLPGKDVCWSYNGKSWNCQPKDKDLDGCRYNQVDVQTCNLELPKVPSCPKDYLTECEGPNNIKYLAGEVKEATCWYYDLSKGINWKCSPPISKGKLGCAENQLDIEKCDFKKPEIPSCPPIFATCKMDNQDHGLAEPSPPLCWKPALIGYECKNKILKGAIETCPLGFVDINQCNYTKSSCPPEKSSCKSKTGTHNFEDNDVPVCWTKDIYGWKCANISYESECPINAVDIREC